MPHWIALIPGQSTRSPCTEPTVLDAQHLGWWCLQFTPRVALLDEAVVAEIQASHRLFGGRTRLVEHMDATSRRLGCIAVAQADTAAAAVALARHPGVPLPELPLQAISALRPHSGTLSRLGCRRIQDVIRLPRAGLSRRFGKELLRALDQLDGTQPEAFEWLCLPAVFESRLELPGRVDSAPQLSLGADILIHRLCAWLAGLQAGVHAWTLRWQHDFFRQRDVESQGECTIRLGSPSRDPKRLTRLMHEHLQRIELAGPVDEITLHANEISSLQDDCRSLFPELSGEALSIRPDVLTTPTAQKRQRDGLIKLTERWGARLGASSVKQGCLHADHRPERALIWHAAHHAHRPNTDESLPAPEQPLPHWLLPEPQPLSVIPQGPSQQEVPYYQGRLRLLAGPHRIEAGWWDGSSVVRDYYIASSERAGLLWIFLDRTPRTESAQGPWFLHGLFG